MSVEYARKVFHDGRYAVVVGLLLGRARITVSAANDPWGWYDAW